MRQIRPYQLTEWTEEHLVALAQVFNKGHNVNYAFFEVSSILNLSREMKTILIRHKGAKDCLEL